MGQIRSMKRARDRQQAKVGEITISLGQALGSTQSLNALLGMGEIPIRQSFLIGKKARSLSTDIEQYQVSRKALCERYAEKDADGKPRMIDGEGKVITDGRPGNYDISEAKMPEFEKEHQDLLATEVTIPGTKIKVNDLSGVKIAPAHVMSLDFLLKD